MSSDQMPAPGKIKLIKFPPPGQEKTSNARDMPRGGGCWSFDLTDTLRLKQPARAVIIHSNREIKEIFHPEKLTLSINSEYKSA